MAGKAVNPRPELDLSGPTVEEDVRRLVARYGVEAVRTAVRERTGRKRGRPSDDADWISLSGILAEDATCWLDGGDPFAERSNYSIAQQMSEPYAEPYRESVHRRIMGKLGKLRRYHTYIYAEKLSWDQRPHGDYMRVLSALVGSGKLTKPWHTRFRNAEASIADYNAKFGQPDAGLTMQEIEIDASKSLPAKPAPEIENVLQVLLDPRKP